jgi:hypothetical protein
MEPHAPDEVVEPPAIADRTDTGGGWSRVLPLIALAFIGLIAVRACVQPPSVPASPATVAPASR